MSLRHSRRGLLYTKNRSQPDEIDRVRCAAALRPDDAAVSSCPRGGVGPAADPPSACGGDAEDVPEFQFGSIVPFPRDEVFEYVTDPRNWPELLPEIERVDVVDAWDKPGDRCRVRLRAMGNREYEQELLEFDRPRLTRDIARQPGLPEIEHERVFAEIPEGTWLQNYARYEPRRGLVGLFDRTLLAWLLGRRYQRTFQVAAERVVTNLAVRHRPAA
jgi:hypothetical protein